MWGEGPLGHFTEFPQSQHGKRSIPWILAPKSTAGGQAVESHMTLIQSNIRMARVFTVRPRVGQKRRERERQRQKMGRRNSMTATYMVHQLRTMWWVWMDASVGAQVDGRLCGCPGGQLMTESPNTYSGIPTSASCKYSET